MNRNSNLFREEPIETIKEIIKNQTDDNEIHDCRLLEGGMFNTTYLVEYGGEHKKVILQFAPVNRHLLLGFENNLMEAEAHVYSLCGDLKIKCPRIIAFDNSHKIIDRDYIITEYIPSISMSKADLIDQEKEKLFFAMGEYLSEMHKIEGDYFGHVSFILRGIKHDSWKDAVLSEVGKIIAFLKRANGITDKEADRIIKLFEENANLFDCVDKAKLIHTDLWEGNVLIDPDSNAIVAIIDSDRAIFGDPDFEFAPSWMDNESIRRGYGLDYFSDMSNERKKKIDLYKIYYCLVDAYVGFCEYNDMALYNDRMDYIKKTMI